MTDTNLVSTGFSPKGLLLLREGSISLDEESIWRLALLLYFLAPLILASKMPLASNCDCCGVRLVIF